MSIYISKNEADKINCVNLIFKHPLVTFDDSDDKTKDDVLYIFFPKKMLEPLINSFQACIKKDENFKSLFTTDIKLRNDFDCSDI